MNAKVYTSKSELVCEVTDLELAAAPHKTATFTVPSPLPFGVYILEFERDGKRHKAVFPSTDNAKTDYCVVLSPRH